MPFSNAENFLLVELYGQSKQILTSKQTNIVTNKLKEKNWEKIAAECRNVNPTAAHTVENVKVRWDNMFMSVKRKISALRKYKTGGGDPPNPLTKLEEQIHLLFEDSSLLKGIGGIESGKSKEEPMTPGNDITVAKVTRRSLMVIN